MKSRWGTWLGPRIAALTLLAAGMSRADDAPAHEEVIERYEQILERAPVEGPSFDKLLQIYQEGEGLEKLDERWTPWSAQPGVKGATYSLLRGLLADRMGKTDAARKLLQAATQGAPDDFHGWMALGDFEVRQGKWTDAIAAFQKGLATNVAGDDRLSLYRKLGQAQQRNLDVPAALATWQKMVEEFPKDSFALEEAGGAELDAEQFDEAKKTFQQLVDLTEPNSMARVQALMHLAEVDDRQGKTEAAVHDYEAILPLTAESSWLNRELRAQIEQVYRREDDLAGLVTYYQKWTQDNPKDVEALLLLAGTLNELGKKPEALDVLRKVTVLAPDRHEVRESFAEALVDAKQYDEAITVLTALTADDPTEPRYWATMGDALWLKTQPPTPESKKATLEAWGHIAPPESKDVAAMLEVADLCHERGLNDEALAGYQRALAITPDASDIREKSVKLLVEMKRPDDAWKLLDQMVDGPLATASNYLKLAALDAQFDRKDAAADAIQKGLALEPNNFDLLSAQWSQLAEAQKWSDCVALFDKLMAAAPNAYFTEQIEERQMQALNSAGMLDDAEKKLHDKLGADPGLSEGDLRMLLRMLVQKSDPDIPKALDEAHRRFPQSVSLIQIEVDYDRHIGNSDGAVASLQKLVEAVPAQKADWLGEIVRIRREQGNNDEAMKVAQQIIDASPASADGYMLYADVAFAANKPDDAVTKLQAAIKLSDKPNDVRQRLARYYLESGQSAKARTVYEEAFAAAENPQDKLTIVRQMAAAYFQDGQIDDLINRFKKEQSSEEGGWRYGLYLSAIDEEMQDYGAARRELAKSLAVRPQDTGLLHSLIGLAEKENDAGELLRYREMLAEADPSVTNEIALANEYAIQNRPEDTWRIVQKNLNEVVKDPMAWKDVLNQISDPAYQSKVKSVLEEAIRTKGDSFDGKFALAQFQMQQGDLDGAKGTLWDILAQPLPPTSSAKPAAATTNISIGNPLINSFYQTPIMQRSMLAYQAISEAQQLLASSQQRSMMQRGMMNRQIMLGRMGISTTLDPQAIRDHALIYLSFIAVQQKQAEDFLKELETKFGDWHWSLGDRLVAFSMIQAREPLLAAIEEQVKSTTPDQELDQFCYMACEQFMQPNVSPELTKRASDAQTAIGGRMAKDDQFKNYMQMIEISRLASDTTPAGIAKRKAAIDEYVKTIDRKDPQQLFEAIGLYSQVGNWDEIRKTIDDLGAIDPSKWNVFTTQQMNYLPSSLLQQAATNKDVAAKDIIPVVLKVMQMGYPATPPKQALPSSTGQIFAQGGVVFSGMGFYNQNTFPPSNRYFPPDRVGNLEPMYQQLKARNMLADMYAGLDQQEKELTDWRKIYPELMRIYFQWWDGKHDDAIASVKKLLDQDSSDDWRTLLAKMLELDQKYNDAIPVLESVSARYGPTYIQTQKQLLHVARLANNNDAGQKAALRLLSLHLPQQELLQIMDDLRNVGLKDKADEIMNKQVQGRMPTAAGMQANNQLMRTLNEASNQKDGPKVLELAQQVLNRDPLAQQMGNDNFLRIRALEALKRTGQLDAYIQDVEKQLAAAPDSAKLNWLAAEAYLQQATGNSDDAASAVASAKAVTYFRKVADLSPKNQNLLVSVAQRLYQAHKPDAAADLYASIFKSDFSTGMNQWNNAMQAFQEANRLPEFVKLVNDWTPPPLTPMGGGPDLYYVIVQIANQLKQNDHKPEAEQIYRKALAMDTFQSKQDTVSSLAQMLMDEGRRDEAAAEVEKWVLNQNVQPAAPPILGFNMPQVNQGNWFQSIGWSSNGVIQAPILHFLELADALGLGPKLRQELKARADKNVAGTTTPPQGTPIDSDRMAALMLAIIARDPSYKADLEKMIKDYPVTATMQMNTNGYLIVSQELEKWPEERPMALRLTKMAYDSMNTMPNNFFFQNIVVQQMLRLAEADGDHKTMQDVLRKEVAGIREQRSINPQQVPLDQDLRVVHTLIQEGMLKEASDLLADAKTDPQLANGNNYFKQRLDDAQNELSFAKGEKSKVGLVYGIVPKKGKKEGDVQFFWDVVPGNSQNNGGYFSRSAWAEGGTTHPTSYRIEISGGADEPHMTHFTSWDNVASRGSVTVSIPPGVQVIQATLIRTKPEPPGPVDPGTTPPPPEPVPSAVATGQVILLGGPDNLLKNPNFQISKDASGKTTTDGWHGLISPGATQEKGGPMPDGTYQTLEAINGNFGQSSEVVSDKIPLQPNTNYVFSGWMRLSGNIAFRYTDASGKVLNPNQIVWGGNDTDWQWRAWVLQGNPHSPVGGETIPPNAAFVEISLRPNQDSDFAGLALREWPAPTTAPAPAPAK